MCNACFATQCCLLCHLMSLHPSCPDDLFSHLPTHAFKQHHALQVLEKVRGTTNVDAEYDDILEACDISHALAGKWKVLFTQKYRPVLVGSGEGQLVLGQVRPVDPILLRLCTRAPRKAAGIVLTGIASGAGIDQG